MNRKSILISIVLAVLSINTVLSHGLSMTTASVTLRQKNHISIRIQTSLPDLASRMEWPGKPKSLMHLSSADEKQMVLFRKALVKLFTKGMPITIGNKPMQSQMARPPTVKRLRKMLQSIVAEQIMTAKQPVNPGHGPHERADYIEIFVDGFVAKKVDSRDLHIPFPTELGPITVSYSKPQMQTLPAGEKTTGYRQVLD